MSAHEIEAVKSTGGENINNCNPEILKCASARIHGRGEARRFRERGSLSIARFGIEPVDYLMRSEFIPVELRATYGSVAREVLSQIR